ncbi:hypothetical protein LIBO111022_12315 [Listeria booriae]|uniref:Uncharacterized protein n=1 Tax=Listeria booriae TaxID=1552123 RepID=A0A099VWN5_9LIST|nr:hypothetical protein [Listeria booriae]KGL37944.1 hypothetical protein EP57_15410 [Listeria booriae]STY45941.1 Uncharacterised protein [Listeria booriae]
MVVMIIFMVLVLIGCGYFFFYRSKGILRIKQLLDIKTKYAQQTTGAKRLIIGGSDVLYSFDTDKIERETAMPTVNFGVNVGLGMGFLLDEAKRQAKPGDEVVLCLAYSLYFKPAYDVFAYEYYRMFEKRQLTRFTWKQHAYYLIGNFKLNMGYKQKQFDISTSGAYVNVSGALLPDEKYKPLQFPVHFRETEAVLKLESFCEYCRQEGIRVRVTYPSTLGFEAYDDSLYLQQLVAYLEANYRVIGTPSDYFVPRAWIFNSVYHVNDIGQQVRTEQLLEEMRKETVYEYKPTS